MTVKDVMVDDVVTIDASVTLLEAAQVMRDANIGMLPVMEHGRLAGVVTDRDLVVRGMAENANPSTARVRDCYTTPVIRAYHKWSVEEAMMEMAKAQIGRLPVIDEQGRLVGVVTLSSLALRSPDTDQTLETAQEVSRRSERAA